MARKKNAPTAAAYNSAFPRTLRTLMKNRVPSVTQSELGKAIGKTRQAVGYYSDGSSSPDWETLVKIADFFNVSVDYLLGRTRVMSPDASLHSASKYTGLSEEAITAFLRMKQHPPRPDFPSIVITAVCCGGFEAEDENVTSAVDSIKTVVDYVIDAVKSLK